MIRGSTHSRWIASVSTALAVVGCVVAPFLPAPPAAAATLAGWTGWDTSPTDATRRLAVITPSAAAATSTVLVDPTARGQVWQGVGASLTDASVSLLKNNSSAVSMLFDPAADKGAHLNIVRLPLSSTDFSPTLWNWSQSGWTATPPAQGISATNLITGKIQPLRRDDLKVVATNWSAPASMKTTGTLRGGALTTAGAGTATTTGTYAKLLVGQASWLLAHGVPLKAMTLGNEPFYNTDYTSMTMSDAQMITLAKAVGPKLAASGVALWAIDHNWNYRKDYDTVLSGAPGIFTGSAFHCYGGSPAQMQGLGAPKINAPPIMTECTGTTGDWSGTFAWDMQNLVVDAVNAGSTGLMMWNLALNPKHGPVDTVSLRGCKDCRGLLTIDPANPTTPSPGPEFYTLAHLARAADVGSTRIALQTQTTGLEATAFDDGGGIVSVVGQNNTGADQTVRVQIYGGAAISFDVKKGDLFTFRGPAGSYNVPPAGSYEGHIVQWAGDTKAQKTAWLVRNGKRYWIPDAYSYSCFQNQSAPGPDVLPSSVLDALPDQTGQQAQCIPAASSVEGHIVQWNGDTKAQKTAWLVRNGKRYWIPDTYSYSCFQKQGAPGPDSLPSYVLDALPDQSGQQAQCIPPPGTFENHIVQWNGDTKTQKTAWLVSAGHRYWIPNIATYGCLQSKGAAGPDSLPSYVLDSLPDTGQQAACLAGAEGQVLHVGATGRSYFIDSADVRHSIPDGGVYLCLTAWDGVGIVEGTQAQADTFPDGSTETCQVTQAFNTIVRVGATGTSYYIDGAGVRHWIPSGGVFNCLYWWNGVPLWDNMNQAQADAFADGSTESCQVTQAFNTIVRVGATGTSYYIDGAGVRHWIPNGGVFNCLYWWDGVTLYDNLNQAQVDTFADGSTESCQVTQAFNTIVRVGATGTSYYIDGAGVRHWIPSGGVFNCLYWWNGVPLWDNMNQAQADTFADGSTKSCQVTQAFNTVIRESTTGTAYFVDGGGIRHWIQDGATYNCLVSRYGVYHDLNWEQVDTFAEGSWQPKMSC